MTSRSLQSEAQLLAHDELVVLLKEGEVEELGVIPWSSNYAFLVSVAQGGQEVLSVYKPRRGERPLWDFPVGTLYRREIAAFLLSESLGWGLVPPTVLRNGPYGPGSMQLFIDSDPELHYFNVYPRHAHAYRRIALFDIVANNADRKAGHCLLDDEDHVWSIDHGICFHVAPKLRTVIWEFAGDILPPAEQHDLQRLHERLQPGKPLALEFGALLQDDEVMAIRTRLENLLTTGHFPTPNPQRRNHPWPPI